MHNNVSVGSQYCSHHPMLKVCLVSMAVSLLLIDKRERRK